MDTIYGWPLVQLLQNYQVFSVSREGLLVLLGGGHAVERGYRGRHQQQPRRGPHHTSHRNHDVDCWCESAIAKSLVRHSGAQVTGNIRYKTNIKI